MVVALAEGPTALCDGYPALLDRVVVPPGEIEATLVQGAPDQPVHHRTGTRSGHPLADLLFPYVFSWLVRVTGALKEVELVARTWAVGQGLFQPAAETPAPVRCCCKLLLMQTTLEFGREGRRGEEGRAEGGRNSFLLSLVPPKPKLIGGILCTGIPTLRVSVHAAATHPNKRRVVLPPTASCQVVHCVRQSPHSSPRTPYVGCSNFEKR